MKTPSDPVLAPGADLPPVEERTRDTVLRLIAEQGPVRAIDIAATLNITPTAVRRHLVHLQEHGLVADSEPVAAPRGRGRPARAYVVTSAGHSRLHSAYDDIAADALRFVVQQLGRAAIEQFARERAAQLTDRYAPMVVGDDTSSRAVALAAALADDGYAATARAIPRVEGQPGTGGVQLCQGHCPVQSVASEFSELCDAERAAFEGLLGVPVQRLSTLAGGGHVCTTFVPNHDRLPGLTPSARPASSPGQGVAVADPEAQSGPVLPPSMSQ